MKIVVDTNIVLDVLGRREPFFEHSNAVLKLVAEGRVEGSITANSVTDIYYILRKNLEEVQLRAALRGLMELLEVIEVSADECLAALDMPIDDYEDALLVCCARRWNAESIITRNQKDFVQSPIKALSPSDFLESVIPD